VKLKGVFVRCGNFEMLKEVDYFLEKVYVY